MQVNCWSLLLFMGPWNSGEKFCYLSVGLSIVWVNLSVRNIDASSSFIFNINFIEY